MFYRLDRSKRTNRCSVASHKKHYFLRHQYLLNYGYRISFLVAGTIITQFANQSCIIQMVIFSAGSPLPTLSWWREETVGGQKKRIRLVAEETETLAGNTVHHIGLNCTSGTGTSYP
jgi:hypothetical protein